MNPSHSSCSGRFNPWPISIIGFFVVAILGCATFITFCSWHPADLISPNYYEEEVKYQGQIDRLQQTSEHAGSASVTYDVATRRIAISLPPDTADSRPAGTIQFYRPSAVNLDCKLALEVDSKGRQTIDGGSLLPGLWKVRVSWTVNNRDFFIDEKLVVPAAVL